MSKEICSCGVPFQIHNTACGWENAGIIIQEGEKSIPANMSAEEKERRWNDYNNPQLPLDYGNTCVTVKEKELENFITSIEHDLTFIDEEADLDQFIFDTRRKISKFLSEEYKPSIGITSTIQTKHDLKCVCECGEHGGHRGQAKRVIINGNGWKDAEFIYCDAAIERDIKEGFEIIIKK